MDGTRSVRVVGRSLARLASPSVSPGTACDARSPLPHQGDHVVVVDRDDADRRTHLHHGIEPFDTIWLDDPILSEDEQRTPVDHLAVQGSPTVLLPLDVGVRGPIPAESQKVTAARSMTTAGSPFGEKAGRERRTSGSAVL
jgi:hypothetical protein